jgi:hypothetical protein
MQIAFLSNKYAVYSVVCRTLADPSFPHKMALEFMVTFSSSIWWEMNIRKERYVLPFQKLFNNLTLLHH